MTAGAAGDGGKAFGAGTGGAGGDGGDAGHSGNGGNGGDATGTGNGGNGGAAGDSNGNAGTTAWWDGRIVGCWVQDAAGVVEVRALEKLPAAARKALAAEAERLTTWLDGVRIGTVYPSAAMKVVDWVHP